MDQYVTVPFNARNAVDRNIEFMNTAEVTWLFYHSCFFKAVLKIRTEVPTLKNLVCIDRQDGDIPSMLQFIKAAEQAVVPHLSEDRDRRNAILGTGGTTDKSKGGVWSDLVWETMIASMSNCMPFAGRPVHLLVAPMTHEREYSLSVFYIKALTT